jgi:hypothetical protein
MASPSWKWMVRYLSTFDPGSSDPAVLEGELHLWRLQEWIILIAASGAPLIGKFLTDNERIEIGSIVQFSSYQAKVVRCILSPGSEDKTSSDLPLVAAYDSREIPHLVKTWKISYSTCRDLDRGRMKAYDGSLCLYEDILLLKNVKGERIGYRSKEKHDIFSVGAKLKFPSHVVRMGLLFGSPLQPCVVHAACMLTKDVAHSSHEVTASSEKDFNSRITQQQGKNPREENFNHMEEQHSHFSEVHGYLNLGFSFSHGRNFARDVLAKFQTTVAPSDETGHFQMVLSFGRANFKMEEDLVGIALEAVVGGQCDQLKVSWLNDRVFSFCVASKEVGFHIVKLRKLVCTQFKCYFHLWGRGGPNWKWEFAQWEKDGEKEWTMHG